LVLDKAFEVVCIARDCDTSCHHGCDEKAVIVTQHVHSNLAAILDSAAKVLTTTQTNVRQSEVVGVGLVNNG